MKEVVVFNKKVSPVAFIIFLFLSFLSIRVGFLNSSFSDFFLFFIPSILMFFVANSILLKRNS